MVKNFKKYFARFISPEAKSASVWFDKMLISASGEEKQKEILDSIYYAGRIQRALITNEKYFEKALRSLNKTKKQE